MPRLITSLAAFLTIFLSQSFHAQSSQATPAPQAQSPQPARGASQEVLGYWNQIGKRLIDMAEDFPEDKYSFKPQKDQRSFGENFVHVADEDYRLMTAIKGAPMGPAGGKELKPEDYKTKAAVVKLIKQVVADGAAYCKSKAKQGSIVRSSTRMARS